MSFSRLRYMHSSSLYDSAYVIGSLSLLFQISAVSSAKSFSKSKPSFKKSKSLSK